MSTTPKKPQDRKTKADAPLTAEVGGRTWTVERDAMDDFELLEDLGEVEAGNAARLPRVLRRLLGADQYREAMDHLRDDAGKVGVEAGANFVRDLFEGLPQQGN